ncbi:hypothetical protein [Hyphobacterium marinum]|uniref:Uncharacterized protein n=1 Tax=Hyphobacterium marinum TaxID=3116574 RepID=A0ABU7M091_9PROT|nr:hypothetical protein [Hyphobacterium sp. Y6023]MEE2567237.1 hypothetical protein [Hyphobacterium sp. Y6023]
MNPLAFFLPGQRASSSTFFIGLVVLAVLDAARLYVLQAGMLPDTGPVAVILPIGSLIVMMLFVLFLFMNRRADAQRGPGLAFLPVGLSLLIRIIAGGIFVTVAGMGLMQDFASSQGQDWMTAAQDPAFQDQFEAWLEANPENAGGIDTTSAIISFVAFWVPAFLFGLWFGGMKPETE